MGTETYARAHQTPTKTACKATLNQMLSSVCHRFQESTVSIFNEKYCLVFKSKLLV